MKRIVYIICMCTGLLLCAGCLKPDTPQLSADCSLSALKCYVYAQEGDWSKKTEIDLLSGKFYPDRGYISYTFKAEDGYTEDILSRCRLEASIPATATIEEMDLAGNGLGHGFDGIYNLYDNTLYFRVIAANGENKVFQLVCAFK